MRVIIAGSRDFNNYNLLRFKCLDIFRSLKAKGYNTKRGNVEIISGTARGADKLGERFSKEFGLKLKRFSADWSLGKRAGYLRNKEMARYASEDKELGALIAFWNGKSKGTRHMINLAKKYNLTVFVIKV